MQLGNGKPLRVTLSALTAALLGSGAVKAAESAKVDSDLLIYSESGRVKVAEGVLDYSKVVSERQSVGVRLTLDALTGASPTGAAPSNKAQTFTGPSGGVGYTIPAGQIPVDSTFHDTRFAVDGRLMESLDRVTMVKVGAHVSKERDYLSFGLNGGITRDFNRRNTTLGISGSYSHDIVSPIGGAPAPLTAMPPPSGLGQGLDDRGATAGPGKGKDVVGGIAGITQVIGRETILRVDYSVNRTSGYLNDPYKLVSLVQGDGSTSPGTTIDNLYENRPGVRNETALFTEVRQYLFGSALDLSYRFFRDDWGIRSHTADALWRFPLPDDRAIEPHFRWYRQTAADFYHPFLVDGQGIPLVASADTRLAAFDAMTFGLKYSFALDEYSRMSISAEYYTQLGSRGPPDAPGFLAQYNLFPNLNAGMVRIGYKHDL